MVQVGVVSGEVVEEVTGKVGTWDLTYGFWVKNQQVSTANPVHESTAAKRPSVYVSGKQEASAKWQYSTQLE